jgi:hypothetical protein
MNGRATDRRTLLPVGLALAGLVVVLVGLHQELLTAATPGGPTASTGWDGSHLPWGRKFSDSERYLGAVATAALPLAAATAWRRHLGYLVAIAGAGVAGYALLVAGTWLAKPWVSTGLPGDDGGIVLAAEPYLLVLGGLLLVAAGLVGAWGIPIGEGNWPVPERIANRI